MVLLEFIFFFLIWTLMLYLIHVIVHFIPLFATVHWDHHEYVYKNKISWSWNNLFLFNNTWKSTLDLWIIEVIPTLLFCWFTQQWWIFVFYYVWSAFIEERVEHSIDLNLYPLTTGQWHMVHHKKWDKNFGLFIPIWDKLFKTEDKSNL